MTSHLTDATAQLLSLSKEERIQKVCSPCWVGYPQAKIVLNRLNDLLVYPKSHRMPNLLIVGDTNNGKTMLVKRFCNQHQPEDKPTEDGVNVPVLYVQAPPVPEEGRFFNAILERLFAPFKPNDRLDRKQYQVLKLLRYVELKVLVIDEIHHILAGSMHKQRAFLNVIKYLGNELQIPIVAVGTKDAFRAIQTDPQLANRFDPALLPKWKLDNDYLRLLVSFERLLPLQNPSNLHSNELSRQLFVMSEGYIGELARLISQAATQAIRNDQEQIDVGLLQSLNWVAPSSRNRQM